MDSVAERVLSFVATQPEESEQEFAVALDDATDRQTRRLLRPLLACLAVKSASEADATVNLYGGRLSFARPGPSGPVWVVGDFENQAGNVRIALRRASRPTDALQGDRSAPKPVPGTAPTAVFATHDSLRERTPNS